LYVAGTLCETNIDDCVAVNCHNGECVDSVNNYTCSCDPGYEGNVSLFSRRKPLH